ncbi:hypothetical protein OAR97_00760 [Arcobacteraceae bacterium]|nr:hypothetical protein [Arcobacteraceae bacterium]
MIIEKFSKHMIESKIFDTYVATVFFASLIFFVLNSSIFTPLEMMFGIVISTVLFKGVANIMLSMTISLVNLDNTQNSVAFKKDADNLESLVNDLAIQEAAIQSGKNSNK